MRTAAKKRGLTVRQANAERLVIQDHVASGVVVNGETEQAGAVAIAGGAWSEAFAAQLGVDIPVAPQRGQIIHLGLDTDTSAWPIVSAFHGHYMVPWADNRVVVGATRETGSGFLPRPAPREFARCSARPCAWLPGWQTPSYVRFASACGR